MKSIAVASAFILAASAIAVPFTEKSSNTVVRRMERPVEVHAPVPFQRKPENKNHAASQSNSKPSHTADGSVTVNNRPQRRDNATTTDEPAPTISEAPEAKNSTMSSDLRRRDNATSTDEPATSEDPEAKNSTMTEGPAHSEEKNSTMSSGLRRREERPVEVHIVPYHHTSENKNDDATEHKAASNNKPSHTADGSVTVNNRPQRRDNATMTDESTPTASETPETKNSTMSGDMRRRDDSEEEEEPATPEDPEAKNSTMSNELRSRMERPVEVHIVPFHQMPEDKDHATTGHKADDNNEPDHTVDGTVAVNNRPQRRDNATTTDEPAPTASEAPEAKNSTMSSDLRRRANETSTEESTPEDSESKNSTMTDDPTVSENKNSTGNELRRRDGDGPTDTQILQYALTLEHLEKAFYDGALQKFDHHAFVKAGLPKFARQRFEQIAEHEATHVEFLTTALGPDAVAACNYTFPYNDPKSFAALSMVLEGVGVSAYLGAAQFIDNKEYLTAAGSILTTESRHAAWVASAVNQVSPWSGAFDTPLDFAQVYSLAALFITDCPSTNPELFKAFPALEAENKHYKAGDYITLKFDATPANGQPTFLAIFSGINKPEFVAIENNKAQLPKDLEGTSYGVVTTSNSDVLDQNTVAGVAIFELYSDSHQH